MLEQNSSMKRTWAASSPELDEPATVAQRFDSLLAFRFYRLLFVGMARRMLEIQEQHTPDKELAAAHARIDEAFKDWAADLESELNYLVIPILDLVQIQLGAAFYMISAL